MAQVYQTINPHSDGERRYFEYFKNKLPNSWHLWHDVEFNGNTPDFIVFHPKVGLLVIEVKDWGVNSIADFGRDEFNVMISGRRESKTNPLIQAKRGAHAIVDELKKAEILLQAQGSNSGRLCFPYGYMAAFTNIGLDEFYRKGLDQVIDRKKVLLKDDFGLDSLTLASILSDGRNALFQFNPLNDEQIKAVINKIYPIVRGASPEPIRSEESEQIFVALDREQAELAKRLKGHNLIRGVAGSGKSIIIGWAANTLASQFKGEELVLCYNKVLVPYLEWVLKSTHDIYCPHKGKITVINFHKWCKNLCDDADVRFPNMKEMFDDENALGLYMESLIDDGKIEGGRYDAIFIDEGQDFHPAWLSFIVKMLNRKTDFIVMVYDDAQSIFQSRRFSFKSCGLKIAGKSKTLRTNYRNTKEIAQFAEMACYPPERWNIEEINDDETRTLIKPLPARSGQLPELREKKSLDEQASFIAEEAKNLVDAGLCDYCDIGILYPRKGYGGEDASIMTTLIDHLKKRSLPYALLTPGAYTKGIFDFSAEQMKVSTIHSAKGLEFKVGFIFAAESIIVKREHDSMPLLYVAMTRAQDKLYITYSGANEVTAKLREAYNSLLK